MIPKGGKTIQGEARKKSYAEKWKILVMLEKQMLLVSNK